MVGRSLCKFQILSMWEICRSIVKKKICKWWQRAFEQPTGPTYCFQGYDYKRNMQLTVLLESSILDYMNTGFTNTTYRRASSKKPVA